MESHTADFILTRYLKKKLLHAARKNGVIDKGKYKNGQIKKVCIKGVSCSGGC